MGRRTIAALLVAVLLGLAACGDDDDATSAAGDAAGDAEETVGDGGDESADTDASAPAGRDVADGEADDAATTTAGSSSSGFEAGADDVAEPQQEVGLQAGSVDDNEHWEAYLRYREAFASLGIAVDDLPVEGRRVLTVVDGAGAPVHDAVVTIGDTVLRTGTDGRAVYLGRPTGGQQQTGGEPVAVVTHGGATAEHAVGADPAQTIVLLGDEVSVDPVTASTGGDVRLDLHFLIDATGSMDDEIERLKANMVGVAERIAGSEASPDVRFALTSYRDEGDAYVARTTDFTADVGAFVESLRGVVADGGGDHPEAFNEAFAEAVARPSWRRDEGVVRLVVLIADAPPHIGRGPSYVDTIGDAAAAGIRVFPIASSGTDDQAEYVFRQVAQATLGRFVFLSYGAGGAAVGSGSNIDEVDYDVLSLDDLVVRLVEEQLAPLVA